MWQTFKHLWSCDLDNSWEEMIKWQQERKSDFLLGKLIKHFIFLNKGSLGSIWFIPSFQGCIFESVSSELERPEGWLVVNLVSYFPERQLTSSTGHHVSTKLHEFKFEISPCHPHPSMAFFLNLNFIITQVRTPDFLPQLVWVWKVISWLRLGHLHLLILINILRLWEVKLLLQCHPREEGGSSVTVTTLSSFSLAATQQ